MDTILNPIAVPGWEQLKTEHPTRARVLQALTNLELGFYFGLKPGLPTRKAILVEAIRLGADVSPTSQQTVQRHLDELADSGHVIKVDQGTPSATPKGRPRGRKSPWRSRYLLLDEVARRGQVSVKDSPNAQES
jgi:hypothetical protein